MGKCTEWTHVMIESAISWTTCEQSTALTFPHHVHVLNYSEDLDSNRFIIDDK